MSSSTGQASVQELFGQAARTFEEGLKSATKFQEEAANWAIRALDGMGSPQQWQKRSQALTQEMIAAAQKGVEEMVRVMNQNATMALELLQKGLEATPVKAGAAEGQNGGRELWETALAAWRTNTQGVLQAHTRLVESWVQMAKILAGEQNGQQ